MSRILTTNMGYAEFWSYWDLGGDGPTTLPYYTNKHGTPYWRRSNGARILGFSCYRPDRQPSEQFYYHHLITTVPFRNINDLMTEENEDGTYERQCEVDEIFGNPSDTSEYLAGVLRALDIDLKRGKVSYVHSFWANVLSWTNPLACVLQSSGGSDVG